MNNPQVLARFGLCRKDNKLTSINSDDFFDYNKHSADRLPKFSDGLNITPTALSRSGAAIVPPLENVNTKEVIKEKKKKSPSPHPVQYFDLDDDFFDYNKHSADRLPKFSDGLNITPTALSRSGAAIVPPLENVNTKEVIKEKKKKSPYPHPVQYLDDSDDF